MSSGQVQSNGPNSSIFVIHPMSSTDRWSKACVGSVHAPQFVNSSELWSE